jgi:hypothetical protein
VRQTPVRPPLGSRPWIATHVPLILVIQMQSPVRLGLVWVPRVDRGVRTNNQIHTSDSQRRRDARHKVAARARRSQAVTARRLLSYAPLPSR